MRVDVGHYGGEKRDVLIVSVLLAIAVGFAQRDKTQGCVVEVLGMREGPVLLGLAAAPKSVVVDVYM
jgi:hypothetical protein